MRAMRVHEFGPPGVMVLEDVADLVAGAGQVVVALKAIGVNPVDTYIRAGTYGPRDFPFTPGYDGAGVVESVGMGVVNIRPGDRVYVERSLSGTYAEKCLCTAAQVHPLPARVSFSQGAGVCVPYATAYRALFQKCRAKSGETVLVHGGSGGVGLAAIQFARAHGMKIIATAGSATGRELVARQGAHHAVDHSSLLYEEQILGLTGGRGVDVIIEMLASNNLDRDLGMLAMFGRIAIVGSRGRIGVDPRRAMQKDAEVYGIALFNSPPADLATIHAAIHAGLENGTLNPIVAKEMPLSEAGKAHDLILQPGAHGKIVLLV
jgi:NADPH2:quinone reductase